MFHTILVPLDGSKRAEQALPLAAQIARRAGGRLHLLRVIPPLDTYAWYGPETAFALPDALRKERVKAAIYLEAVTHHEILSGIHTSIEVIDGEPANAILDAVNTTFATLIVMCSHGQTGLQRWMLGSVSRQIARHASVPVLILRPTPEGEPVPFMAEPASVRVMVPLDGSELAEQALPPAVELAQVLSAKSRGALHLTCVLPLAAREEDTVMATLAQRYLAGVEQRIMESERGRLLTLSSSISPHIDTAQAIVEIAEKGRGTVDSLNTCDIIVMATHGRSGITRWMMGSVTERVLDAGKLPILVVRAHQPITQIEKTAQKAAEGQKAQEEREQLEIPHGVAIDAML